MTNIGYRTGELLKRINAFVVNFDILKSKEQLDNIYWLAKKASELCYYNNPRSELFITMQDAFETSRSLEFCTDFKSFKEDFENRDWRRLINYIAKIPELQYLTDILSKDDLTSDDFDNMNSFMCKDNNSDYFYFDYIDSMRSLYNYVTFKIEFEFDLSKENFFAWAEEAHRFYEKHKYEAVDSISTLFLKALGYDGVWPSKECDNTTYGGIVFERENIEEVKVLANVAKDCNGLDESRRVVEGRDYIYKAKVDNKWLKGRELVNSKKDADNFESEIEPTQRVNQLKKKHKIRKGAKVKLIKMKEACMENTFGWHLSPYSFSEPKINYKAGFGTSFYGAGFYVTLDESIIETIASQAQDIFAEYFIYTIQVDENANIVDEGEEDGLQLYADLVEQFDGDEVKASEEMVARGIDGLLYYSEEDGHSIVFYNPKMAKIVRTEYHEGWGERSELNEGNLKKKIVATMLALGLAASACANSKATTIDDMSEKEFTTHVESIYNAVEKTASKDSDIDEYEFKSKTFYVMNKDAVEKYLKTIQGKFKCDRYSAEAMLITAAICYDFDFETDAKEAFENENLVEKKLKANKESCIQKTGCW